MEIPHSSRFVRKAGFITNDNITFYGLGREARNHVN